MADEGRRSSPAGGADRSPGNGQQRPLVLVVDDDEDIADSIADVLRGGGYEVEQVGDGQQALQTAARAKPALVLLDWRLPNEPAGSALVRKLRDACGHVPVVVLSADPQSLQEARAAQVSDYLPKPFDVRDLLALVDEHCD
jgi:two-component system, OmpR family, phosphate regulon response regulator PhoB